jgi:hypothetical protein
MVVGSGPLNLPSGQPPGLELAPSVRISENGAGVEAKGMVLQPLKDKEDCFSVGFADAFVNRKQAVVILNQLEVQAGRPRGHWGDDG